MPIKHNSKLKSYAQELRKNMTKEERHLWYDYLNTYPIRFRRQVAIENYILDFYCSAVKIAIELDGSQHFTPDGKLHDKNRTKQLEKLGITVIRYSNYDIMKNFRGVCMDIDRIVKERLSKLIF